MGPINCFQHGFVFKRPTSTRPRCQSGGRSGTTGSRSPTPHVPKGLTVSCQRARGEALPSAEEMAYQFAKKKDTPYVQDPVFRANFMKYFVKQLPPPATKQTRFEELDFSQFYRLVDQEKMQKETMTKEEKKALAASPEGEEGGAEGEVRKGRARRKGDRARRTTWSSRPASSWGGGRTLCEGAGSPGRRPDVTLNLDKDAPVPPGDGVQGRPRRRVHLDRALDRQAHGEGEVRLAPRELRHPAVAGTRRSTTRPR